MEIFDVERREPLPEPSIILQQISSELATRIDTYPRTLAEHPAQFWELESADNLCYSLGGFSY
jgi:hypothetical protein